MASLERIRIGQRAPKFCCQALIGGSIQAAFSHSCPTEILAFQKSHEEFLKRNCKVLFVSVDTRNSLWYWQSIPRKDGGLGHIDIPLLSDLDDSIARNYGVVVEELGIDIRGMFLIDGDGVVQQATLDNCPIDRSVSESLRVLDAYQTFTKAGVPHPIDCTASVGAGNSPSDNSAAGAAEDSSPKSSESATSQDATLKCAKSETRRLGHATSWSLLRRDSSTPTQAQSVPSMKTDTSSRKKLRWLFEAVQRGTKVAVRLVSKPEPERIG